MFEKVPSLDGFRLQNCLSYNCVPIQNISTNVVQIRLAKIFSKQKKEEFWQFFTLILYLVPSDTAFLLSIQILDLYLCGSGLKCSCKRLNNVHVIQIRFVYIHRKFEKFLIKERKKKQLKSSKRELTI